MKLALADVYQLTGVPNVAPRQLRAVPDPEPDTVEAPVDELRPQSFDEMIGQAAALRQLKTIMLCSDTCREPAYPHILIDGPSGTGKTTAALLIAKQRGVKCHTATPSGLRVVQDVATLMGEVKRGDVLFIDELQDLPKKVQTAFYTIMEDGWLSTSTGHGRNRTVETVRVPAFTMVGGTTSPGGLLKPFLGRFLVKVTFERYTDDEISRILKRAAAVKRIPMTPDGADALALLSRGVARRAVGELLTATRAQAGLVALKQGPDPDTGELPPLVIDGDVVASMMENFEYDRLGMTRNERRLIRALALDLNGGPIGIEKLATAAKLDIKTAKSLEEWLTDCHLMWSDGSGRRASVMAYQFLTEIDGTVHKPFPWVVGWSRARGGEWMDEQWYETIVR